MTDRPAFFPFPNGAKAPLPFAAAEYEARLAGLRRLLAAEGLDAAVLTSMHGIAYYSGFLYCSFGRPFGLVVTPERSVTVAANIDGGQPFRRCHGEALTYTDWQRDNFWRAVASLTGPRRRLGIEGDHLTLQARASLDAFLAPAAVADIAPAAMRQRMVKSPAEIALIREGARIADLGGAAIRAAIRPGAARSTWPGRPRRDGGRDRPRLPGFRDPRHLGLVPVRPQHRRRPQPGHRPPPRARRHPLAQRLPDDLRLLHRARAHPLPRRPRPRLPRPLGGERHRPRARPRALRPGARCSDVVAGINAFLAERDLLQYRSFGYGHSFGILSHYYGREAGLEFREDIDTVLEPGMVVSMEPMLTVPLGTPGAGGYREHDILVIHADRAENITGFPYGPARNIVPA